MRNSQIPVVNKKISPASKGYFSLKNQMDIALMTPNINNEMPIVA
jgi:hypothetical protein